MSLSVPPFEVSGRGASTSASRAVAKTARARVVGIALVVGRAHMAGTSGLSWRREGGSSACYARTATIMRGHRGRARKSRWEDEREKHPQLGNAGEGRKRSKSDLTTRAGISACVGGMTRTPRGPSDQAPRVSESKKVNVGSGSPRVPQQGDRERRSE